MRVFRRRSIPFGGGDPSEPFPKAKEGPSHLVANDRSAPHVALKLGVENQQYSTYIAKLGLF